MVIRMTKSVYELGMWHIIVIIYDYLNGSLEILEELERMEISTQLSEDR